MRFSAALVGLTIALGAGCEDDEDFTVCSPLSAAELAELPQTLSQAGLFADMDTEALAEGFSPTNPDSPCGPTAQRSGAGSLSQRVSRSTRAT